MPREALWPDGAGWGEDWRLGCGLGTRYNTDFHAPDLTAGAVIAHNGTEVSVRVNLFPSLHTTGC